MRTQGRKRLQTMALVLAVSGAAVAEAGPAARTEDLARMVRPGDIAAVTECSGSKVTGQVMDVSAGSIVLVSDSARRSIPMHEIRRVKLVRRAESRLPEPGADAGARCQDPACMAVALTFGSAKAIHRGIWKLFGSGKTVYRSARPGECSGRTAPRP